MSRITLDLIRKKSEHHDGNLSDMQELTLHQLNISKIEVLNSVCRRLQILYLQNNLISRIENLNKMKDLKYLNLALNNITVIENLEGCEKLERLDLTVNFIDVDKLEQSMACLKDLIFFRQLYLTGNPCTEFPHYREFVIGSLPQLKNLDGKDISVTERLSAQAGLAAVTEALRAQSQIRIEAREKERLEDELAERVVAERKKQQQQQLEEQQPESTPQATVESAEETKSTTTPQEYGPQLPEEKDEDYYARRLREKEQRYTPESRMKIYLEEVERKQREEEDEKRAKEKFGEAPDLIKETYDKLNQKATLNPDGSRPSQRNTGKYPFKLVESSDETAFILEVEVPRFLDTSAIEVDVHPTWIQCLLKGKNLLLHLDDEINVADTRVQRIMTSGKLVITMPRRNLRISRLKAGSAGELRDDNLEVDSLGQDKTEAEYLAPRSHLPKSKPTTTTTATGPKSTATYAANEAHASASLNPVFREVSTRVSNKLMEERRKAEDEAARARQEELRQQALRAEEMAAAKRNAKNAQDANVDALAASLGVDLDDLPPLE